MAVVFFAFLAIIAGRVMAGGRLTLEAVDVFAGSMELIGVADSASEGSVTERPTSIICVASTSITVPISPPG